MNGSKILSNLEEILKMATVVYKSCKILYSIYHIYKKTLSRYHNETVSNGKKDS